MSSIRDKYLAKKIFTSANLFRLWIVWNLLVHLHFCDLIIGFVFCVEGAGFFQRAVKSCLELAGFPPSPAGSIFHQGLIRRPPEFDSRLVAARDCKNKTVFTNLTLLQSFWIFKINKKKL
jgi:hypothetical protein